MLQQEHFLYSKVRNCNVTLMEPEGFLDTVLCICILLSTLPWFFPAGAPNMLLRILPLSNSNFSLPLVQMLKRVLVPPLSQLCKGQRFGKGSQQFIVVMLNQNTFWGAIQRWLTKILWVLLPNPHSSLLPPPDLWHLPNLF